VRRLSTVVRRITWRRGNVTVDMTDTTGTTVSASARAAVVTLPVGVLRHTGDDTAVAFDPPLPPEKRAALEYLVSGDAVKVALWFTSAFWEELRGGRYRNAGFFRRAGLPFTAFWTQVPLRSELVNAWAGGPNATALSRVATAELIERAVDGFGTMLGEPALTRREFESGIVHDWHHDPFARGAYSYLGVGGGDARLEFGAPVDDTLFFAGEATANDGQGGTVNGALHTGERAAREAAATLGKAS
jgi:monoamine oxidase